MVLLGVFMSMGALIMGNLLQVSGDPFWDVIAAIEGAGLAILQGSVLVIWMIWRFPEIGLPLNHPF